MERNLDPLWVLFWMPFWVPFGSPWDPLRALGLPLGSLWLTFGAPWHFEELWRLAWVPTFMVLVIPRCSWIRFWLPCMALNLQVDVFALLWRSLGSVFVHFGMAVGCLRLLR